MEKKENKAKSFLKGRKIDYEQTFGEKNEAAKRVLKDLEKFCRAEESCFHPDVRVHAALEGRREVWLRIQDHLKLNADDLSLKYGKVPKDE